LGDSGGVEFASLSLNQVPPHNHTVNVNVSYDLALPATNFLGNPNVQTSSTQKQKNTGNINLYTTMTSASKTTTLNAESISNSGTSSPHENRMPFLSLNYCIATQGCWPPQP